MIREERMQDAELLLGWSRSLDTQRQTFADWCDTKPKEGISLVHTDGRPTIANAVIDPEVITREDVLGIIETTDSDERLVEEIFARVLTEEDFDRLLAQGQGEEVEDVA